MRTRKYSRTGTRLNFGKRGAKTQPSIYRAQHGRSNVGNVYRLSEPQVRNVPKQIQEFLHDWFSFDLSTGMICKCIREAGVACLPVVDQLIEELQNEEKIHLDETPWFEKGVLKWIWVAVSKGIAVFIIGGRKEEVLLELISETFFGWLISDGYMAYRFHPNRQRCLAHLIRKAINITGASDEKARKMGEGLLRELRALIHEM